MTISPRLLDGFWILVAQMKRKDAYVTNPKEYDQEFSKNMYVLTKRQGGSPQIWAGMHLSSAVTPDRSKCERFQAT